jgi:hypothetical protein
LVYLFHSKTKPPSNERNELPLYHPLSGEIWLFARFQFPYFYLIPETSVKMFVNFVLLAFPSRFFEIRRKNAGKGIREKHYIPDAYRSLGECFPWGNPHAPPATSKKMNDTR